MSIYPYRNESLIQMETYETDPAHAEALVGRVRAKWALLREGGYAGDYPVEVLRAAGSTAGRVKVVELFRWKTAQSKVDVHASEDYQQVCRDIESLTSTSPTLETFTQAVRGFNTNFPPTGG
jgi:hypothetical protein